MSGRTRHELENELRIAVQQRRQCTATRYRALKQEPLGE